MQYYKRLSEKLLEKNITKEGKHQKYKNIIKKKFFLFFCQSFYLCVLMM